MKFEIKANITDEGKLKGFSEDDLYDLEEFINVNIKGRKYGGDVKKFVWGFILFDFKGSYSVFLGAPVSNWLNKEKVLLSNSHIDWNKFSKLKKAGAVKLIKTECLKAIERLHQLKTKPKGFDIDLFFSEVEQVFDHYLKHNV